MLYYYIDIPPLQNPRIYVMASIFSLTGYLGINFVLALVKLFGALVAVTGTYNTHTHTLYSLTIKTKSCSV